MISKKIDFIVTISVENANPNGDPLVENMPRTTLDGFGEISDVCIKRKIRNRMQDMGQEIFVKSKERSDDGFNSLQKRFEKVYKSKDTDEFIYEDSCKRWLDIRSFGQVITFGKRSIGIRGPISISIAKSLSPISITSMQITRSINGEEKSGKASDTMGTKHYVTSGVYVFNGSVNCCFSEKTGFEEKDLEVLKESLRTLFLNDSSSARPDGSMEVKEIFWFEHSNKLGNVSSAKIKELFEYNKSLELENPKYEDYNFEVNKDKLKEYEKLGLKLSIIEGM